MVRPLRLEFAGALYHVTARGDHRDAIYFDAQDYIEYLQLLDEVCQRFHWTVHAYCLMTNHYHLIIETPQPNLASGMRQLNGVYTQRFNRRHDRVGHVFQGRYQAVIVQKETYLLGLARYVVLNPVRTGLVAEADQWMWSSHVATIGNVPAPRWLETDWLLTQFAPTHREAAKRYARFVEQGIHSASPWRTMKHRAILGDETFIAKFRSPNHLPNLREHSKVQRQLFADTLTDYRERYPRNEAMARAYLSGVYSMKQIGNFFGVHYMTVSRAVRRYEQSAMSECET